MIKRAAEYCTFILSLAAAVALGNVATWLAVRWWLGRGLPLR